MIRILNAIICDQVRQETTGKVILIGIYGPKLATDAKPSANATIGLCLWMEAEIPANQTCKAEIQAAIEAALGVEERKAFGQEIEIPAQAISFQQITIQFPCRIDFAHTLRFEIREPGKDWHVLRRLEIAPFLDDQAPAEEKRVSA